MRGTLLGEPPRMGDIAEPVDPVEVLGDEAGLVGLDPPDEVPLDVRVREGQLFLNGLLHIALAEGALTGRDERAHGLGGMALAHRDKRDGVGLATRALAGGRDTRADPLETHPRGIASRTIRRLGRAHRPGAPRAAAAAATGPDRDG